MAIGIVILKSLVIVAGAVIIGINNAKRNNENKDRNRTMY